MVYGPVEGEALGGEREREIRISEAAQRVRGVGRFQGGGGAAEVRLGEARRARNVRLVEAFL